MMYHRGCCCRRVVTPFLLMCKAINDSHPSVPQDTISARDIHTGAELWAWNAPNAGITYGNWRFWVDDTRQTFACVRTSTGITVYQIDDTGATVGSVAIAGMSLPSSLFRDQDGYVFLVVSASGYTANHVFIRITPALAVDEIYDPGAEIVGISGSVFTTYGGNWVHEYGSSMGAAVAGQHQRRWNKNPFSLILGFSCFAGDADYLSYASAAMTTGMYTSKVLFLGNGCTTSWEHTNLPNVVDVAVSGSVSSGICVTGDGGRIYDAGTGSLIQNLSIDGVRSVCLNEANGYLFVTSESGGEHTVSCISLDDYSTVWSVAGGTVSPYLLCSIAGSGHNSGNV